LQELLIAGRKICLIGLLFCRTSRKLGLSALQSSLLSACAETSDLLCALLEGSAVGLFCCQTNALLLLCCLEGLLIALLEDRGDSLSRAKFLLASKVCTFKTSAIPAKGA
jgi:hypothetical protein